MIISKSCRVVVLTAIAASCVIPTLSRAENSVGLELGGNFSSITFNPSLVNSTVNTVNQSGTTQFLFGVLADWGLQDIWYLETELRYNSYGTSIANTNISSGTVTTITETASYLEVPILIKAKFSLGQFLPYVMAGPNFALKVGESSATNGSSFTQSFGNVFKSTNFSLDLGGGVEVPFQPGFSGFFQIRYSLGIANVDSGNNPSEASGTTYKTGGFQVAAGASIPF